MQSTPGVEMTRVLYTARALVSGGRESGQARTSDGALELTLRPPREMGGDGGGTNPEQLFAIGWAACLESVMSLAGQRHGLGYDDVANATVDARVMLMPGKREFILGAAFDVTLPSVDDPALAAEVVREAHGLCPYSNATKGNIDLALTVNGVPLDRD
jgi:lipoyl-dependent peroxiredoxin